jgi:indole-3-glycerol phosphate synthase
VQAPSAWTAPTGTLGLLVSEARLRARALGVRIPEFERLAASSTTVPSLRDALPPLEVAIIAEIKRKSPSKGWIRPGISAEHQARAYAAGGATAVSVLTEPGHFGGSVEDLLEVRRAVSIPVLKKDFHVAQVQLLEAKAVGASAALLIARALSPQELADMMRAASELGLETVVEIRDEIELDRALGHGATIIGINNRNLETLVIDPGTSERLLGLVPAGIAAIAESGVSSRAEVERVGAAGADGVLVGSSVSAASDPGGAVRALVGVRKAARGR